ncbi:MAG: hypothetical protein ACPLKP_02140 [Microgenomates group bacterium]
MLWELLFCLVDITVQFLFRGVYQLRSLVVSGNYDLDLLKPLLSFFRPIFGWTDILMELFWFLYGYILFILAFLIFAIFYFFDFIF